MKIGILESIFMPAGHEIEFDRLLVDELLAQGHEPVMLVPPKFPFKVKYNAEVDYLCGGEVVTYAGAGRLKRLFLSLKREWRRRRWFNSAFKKIIKKNYDALIIPTGTYRFIRTLVNTDLKNSPVPVYIIFHGINPDEKDDFIKQARCCEPYKQIHLKVIALRDDFQQEKLPNLELVAPPVYKPLDACAREEGITLHVPLIFGFFGQYRREKDLRPFLEAFKKANFNLPVRLVIQSATVTAEDSKDFEKILAEYKNCPDINFLNKPLLGKEWQNALLASDVIIAPYANERYMYHWSAMLFTAIGFYKPILQSPETNPEVMARYRIGEVLDIGNVEKLREQLESFVYQLPERLGLYAKGLAEANQEFSQENFVKAILK